jgi:hypothetical protein
MRIWGTAIAKTPAVDASAPRPPFTVRNEDDYYLADENAGVLAELARSASDAATRNQLWADAQKEARAIRDWLQRARRDGRRWQRALYQQAYLEWCYRTVAYAPRDTASRCSR